jgi:hypothetical protein
MTKNETSGVMEYATTAADGETYDTSKVKASWLYIDPKIGNDTNTNELSTSTGGWWYLVESDGTSVKNNQNKVALTYDSAYVTKAATSSTSAEWSADKNVPSNSGNTYAVQSQGVVSGNTIDGDYFIRNTEVSGASGTSTEIFGAKDSRRLYAKLFEIDPLLNTYEARGTNATTNDITKVVSFSFPFVNGTSALPGDALTNVFANAKITIQISFQALQAFFPYSTTIDRMDYTNPLLGTAKALNISNAIPIFNEAFDYQENLASSGNISGL